MRSTYVFHVVGGSIGLLAGYVALYSSKGAPLHRRAGMVFFYAMLAMALAGAVIAVARGVAPAINVPASVITWYLVLTGFAAVREPGPHHRTLHAVGLATALALVIVEAWMAYSTLAWGARQRGYLFPFFLFGGVAAIAAAGDVQLLRHGLPRGSRRIARHLWRMTFALFIAALSFFIGQAQVIPKPIRIMPLLALPVLAVLVTMFYWLWRVRIRRSMRGLVQVRGVEVAG